MTMRVVIALLVVSVTGLGVVFVKNMQSEIKQLTEDNKRFELNLEIQAKKLAFEQHQNELASVRLELLNNERVKAEKNYQQIVSVFGNHDFGKLLAKKPALMEKRINKATQKLFKEFENATF